MRVKMDELVALFHSLQSINLPETKRKLNELIDVIRRDLPLEADLNSLMVSIEPRTKLECILKMELLIRFERYDDLLQILKAGNLMLIGKILKCSKFFEVVFNKIDSQTLVNEIFPQTSFSTRKKIITKLSRNLRNEELADDYFRTIEDKYGLFVAKKLLPACSLDLIKSTVDTYKLILTSRQLLTIVKRDREFSSYYFGMVHQVHGEKFDFSAKYPQVVKYLARVDEQLFWRLFKKYQLKSKFGRHMTPRLYKSGRDVMTTSDYKLNLFNLKKLYKIVRKNESELHRLILQFIPKRVDHLTSEYFSSYLKPLIGYIPENKRYEVLSHCFEKVHSKSIHELLSFNTPHVILELMPVREREIILDKTIWNDEHLIFMYSPKKAIPLLQERIELTSSIRKRSNLLVQLNKTCALNQDSEAFLEVLKYVHSRHRNDNVVLYNFMNCLDQEWPKLEKLTGEHWIYINELLDICKKMTIYTIDFDDISIMLKYLIYLVENGLSYEEFMESFLLHIKEKLGGFGAFYNRKLPKWEKMCYEHFALLLPKLYTGDEFEYWSCLLLASIAVYYNVLNPWNKITISQYPLLMETAKSQITKTNYSNSKIILTYYLKFEDDGKADQIFWNNCRKLCDADIIIWYLQKRPIKILEHLDEILIPEIMQLIRYKLPEILNLVSLLPNISEKIVDFSLKALYDNDALVSEFAALSLSYLATKEIFFEAISPFVPHSMGEIYLNFTKQNFGSTREVIVRGLANSDEPALCLQFYLTFFVSDCMKYACKSLHHVANHTPESKLEFFLNSLYDSTVSIRKDVVNITLRVFPKSLVYNFLKDSGQNDKHLWLRKMIFKDTLGHFVANPSDEIWNLLKDKIKLIDENDRETLGYLVKLQTIPIKYFSEYFSMVYTILSSNKTKKVQAKKYILLAALRNDLISDLNLTTITAVIKETFPNDVQKTDFYLKCLFHSSGSTRLLILDSIFSILKDYVEKIYTLNEVQTNLHKIIYAICLKAVGLKLGKDLIEKFIEFWTSTVKEGKLLEEYLLLKLTNAYLCYCSEDNPRKYGVEVSEVLGEWVGLRGLSAISIFVERLHDFVFEIFDVDSDGRKAFEFIDGLLHASDADFNYIVTLNLLFDRVPWNDIKTQYGPVLTKIREHKSSTLQINLRRRLRNVKDVL